MQYLSQRKAMKTRTQTSNLPHQGVVITRHGYEQSVIVRAMARGGRNPHLKGHIQEVLVQDAHNVRNVLSMNGCATSLTRDTTATTADIITTRAGKVVERIQVKDVTSKSGIDKLVKQCASGKYRSARLVGSEETANLFNEAAKKAGISKRMSSSGVSSKTTESLAQRAGATGSGSLGSAIGQAAKTGGYAGAALGAGFALVKGCVDIAQGKAEVGQVAKNVVIAGAKGGATGAAAGAAATAAGAGTAAAIATLGASGVVATVATVGVPLVAAAAVGYLASEAFDSVGNFLGELF